MLAHNAEGSGYFPPASTLQYLRKAGGIFLKTSQKISPLGRSQELGGPQSEEKTPGKLKRNSLRTQSQARWVPAISAYAMFAQRAGKSHTEQLLATFS